jgi:hypothetical protein
VKFEEAMVEFRHGRRIRRKVWGSEDNNFHKDDGERPYSLDAESMLADDWEVIYTEADYKADMCAMADILGRLAKAGAEVKDSSGERLREIRVVSLDKSPYKDAVLSDYSGIWRLR